jgi:hypothetical protein
MNYGVNFQEKQEQLQLEILHFIILLTQNNFFIRIKCLYLIKLEDFCYNKGLILQIINIIKIDRKFNTIIGYILPKVKELKILTIKYMLSMLPP